MGMEDLRTNAIEKLYAELRECDDPAKRSQIVRDIEVLNRDRREDEKVYDDRNIRMAQIEVDDKRAELDAQVKKKTFWDRVCDVAKVVVPPIAGIFVGLFIYRQERKDDIVSNSVKNAFDSRKYK
jgi:hypothetical protein